MVRMLVSVAIRLGANAIGLLVASWILEDHLQVDERATGRAQRASVHIRSRPANERASLRAQRASVHARRPFERGRDPFSSD